MVGSAAPGCGLDELLQSLRREATSEAEGVAVEGKGPDLDLDVSRTDDGWSMIYDPLSIIDDAMMDDDL